MLTMFFLTWISFFGLCFAHSIPWFRQSSTQIVLDPARLSAALSAVQVLPHFAVVSIWPESSILHSAYGERLQDLMPKFALFYSLGLLAMYAGIGMIFRNHPKHVHNQDDFNLNFRALGIILLFVYTATTLVFIENKGGIQAYIVNYGNQNRIELQTETAFYNILKMPAAYLSILCFTIGYSKLRKPSALILVLCIIYFAGIESGLGSRRGPIQMILFALASIYIVDARAKIVSTTSIIALASCATIFVLILNIRDQASGNSDVRGIISYIVNFSYNDIYIFVLDHFGRNDFWHGSVFLDFAYRIYDINPGFSPPSLDEGVYIYNLYLGQFVSPPLSPDLMVANSWPPRTFGNGYMNFGLPGVLIFFFIQGLIIALIANRLTEAKNNPVWIFIYLLSVFSFQISNLKIAEMIIVLIGLSVLAVPTSLILRIRSGRQRH